MRRWQRFPWHTLWMLLLTSWALGLVGSLWVQALMNTLAMKSLVWTFTFATYFPWEPVVDGVILVLGSGYLGWRWANLVKVLWDKWR